MPFKESVNACEKCDLCVNLKSNEESDEYQQNMNESMDLQSNAFHRMQKPMLKTDMERHLLIQIRNARERSRIYEINRAFWRLEQAVPYTVGRTKRISKVKTLKKALQYIAELEEQLEIRTMALQNTT